MSLWLRRRNKSKPASVAPPNKHPRVVILRITATLQRHNLNSCIRQTVRITMPLKILSQVSFAWGAFLIELFFRMLLRLRRLSRYPRRPNVPHVFFCLVIQLEINYTILYLSLFKENIQFPIYTPLRRSNNNCFPQPMV